ncbi:unnamed protein product, partial [Symbiodinium microadriaticum]
MSRYRDLDVGVETPSPAAASQPKPPHGRKPLTLGRAPEFSDLSPTRNPETLRPHTRPNPCEVKFRGDHGISFEGTRVSHSVLQAWMLGVRPGWTVLSIEGQAVRTKEEIEEALTAAADQEKRYVVCFEKGQGKFGTEAAAEAKEKAEREKRQLAKLRKEFRYQGRIDKAEHRGTTVSQLEKVCACLEENCSAWTDHLPAKMSKTSGQPLRIDFLNFYHLSKYLLLPMTQSRKCAFVEMLTSQPQPPVITSEHREITENPMEAPFHKPMEVCKFKLLVVLDPQAVYFKRTWCLYEMAMSLDSSGATLDVACTDGSVVELITHGLTEEEEARDMASPGQGLRAKLLREGSFPIEAAEAGLAVQSEKSEAELEGWSREKLESVDKRLRARLATALWPRIGRAEKDARAGPTKRASKAFAAIRGDVKRKALTLHLYGLSSEYLRMLAESLPPNLVELKLNLRCSSIKDDDVAILAKALPTQLKELKLDFTCCGGITDTGLAKLAEQLDFGETAVYISLAETGVSKAVQEWYEQEAAKNEANGQSGQLKNVSRALHMSLCLSPDTAQPTKRTAVPAASLLGKVITDDADNRAVAALRALNSFGEKARSALGSDAQQRAKELEMQLHAAEEERKAKEAQRAAKKAGAKAPEAPPPEASPEARADAQEEEAKEEEEECFLRPRVTVLEREHGAVLMNTNKRVCWRFISRPVFLMNLAQNPPCREYSARIKIIQRSWRVANNKASEEEQAEEAGAATAAVADNEDLLQKSAEEKTQRAASKDSTKDSEGAPVRRDSKNEATSTVKTTATELKVPTTFNEMFLFNAAVMGFGQSTWMHLVLDQFDDIVSNVANSYRLQEECDVLSLVLAQHPGSIRLSEFKAVMLASLRSLVPKEWDSNHEVAWNWLWENVERMLRSHIGKPQAHEEALGRFILSLSETSILFLRQELYRRFFAVAPAGQDHFKQSTTRLYFIADKIIEMTVEIFRSPRQMVVDISALGLRHVGYEVPTELFAPFVSAAVDVVRGMTTDDVAEAAFRWSLTLVSKILVRTVLEGSTIVMRAINTNQEKALRKAIAVAPRGRRATELLEIRVGTQSISPLFWAIESGSLNCGKAMIQDLLTIRADRDNYYYGCDDLFNRHPNIIQKLCAEAPTMLQPLLDGLVWRSRITFQGRRRVNYYLKHLVQNADGRFNQALEWLADFKDPKIISHSVVALFADIVWNRLAMYYFLLTRLYFLLTLVVFATSQAILGSSDASTHSKEENIAIFACRCFIYIGSMCHLFIREIRLFVHDWRHGCWERLFNKIPVPEFLCSGQEVGNMLLLWMLIFMCIQEPIWWCIPDTYGDYPGSGLFNTACAAGQQHKEVYAAFSCAAMLLYCVLILDLSILSMRISAFVLVCGRVIAEVGLFLMAAIFLILAFALGISALDRQSPSFEGIGNAAFSLFAMTLGLYPSENLGELKDAVGVLITVSVFTILIAIFLLNLLVAQLNQAYQLIFPDMQGYARLNRASVIVSTVDQVSQRRWSRFLESLNLDERLEFNEGDVGLAGGIQVIEPSW